MLISPSSQCRAEWPQGGSIEHSRGLVARISCDLPASMGDFAKNLQKGLAGSKKALYEDKNTEDGGPVSPGGSLGHATSAAEEKAAVPRVLSHIDPLTQLPARSEDTSGVGSNEDGLIERQRLADRLKVCTHRNTLQVADMVVCVCVQKTLGAVGVSEEDYNRNLARDELPNIFPSIHPDEAMRVVSEVADQAHESLSRPGGG